MAASARHRRHGPAHRAKRAKRDKTAEAKDALVPTLTTRTTRTACRVLCVVSVLAMTSLAGATSANAYPSVTPGQVLPKYKQTYDMAASTAIMICNNSGLVGAEWAARWGLVDIDWNSDKRNWSTVQPMNNEENMLYNINSIRAIDPTTITWVYRNGIKALPWFTTVRTKLEDPKYWGWFMPYAHCNPSPGVYTCGPNATHNLYHDFEQTPRGDCGSGVECGEYVFNHRNVSLQSFLLGDYFFGPTGGANENVSGFYVDDGWSSAGPSEMDKDAVQKMGMSAEDVQAMEQAWKVNQAAWRAKLVAEGKFEWFLFYGGQQTAPGWSQSDPKSTCQSFMTANCGEKSPSQNGTLFFGYSRISHQEAWPLPYPTQDLSAFLLVRGPYAFFGYGWTGCADSTHPFTRPAALEADYGVPQGFCSETEPGVFQREWTKASITLDCNTFNATIKLK